MWNFHQQTGVLRRSGLHGPGVSILHRKSYNFSTVCNSVVVVLRVVFPCLFEDSITQGANIASRRRPPAVGQQKATIRAALSRRHATHLHVVVDLHTRVTLQ